MPWSFPLPPMQPRHRDLPPRWIPVTERLPEYDRTVLLTDGVDVTVAEFVEQDGWSAWYVSMNWRGPIAWMPMPEPPAE